MKTILIYINHLNLAKIDISQQIFSSQMTRQFLLKAYSQRFKNQMSFYFIAEPYYLLRKGY